MTLTERVLSAKYCGLKAEKERIGGLSPEITEEMQTAMDTLQTAMDDITEEYFGDRGHTPPPPPDDDF